MGMGKAKQPKYTCWDCMYSYIIDLPGIEGIYCRLRKEWIPRPYIPCEYFKKRRVVKWMEKRGLI